MPVSITKNKKDEKTLLQMLHAAFPDKEVSNIEELTEGFFNVAYNITLTDRSEVILKIAPPPEQDVMTYEINIMFSEVECMRKVAEETKVPVAKILYYDNSHTICDSDYFLMEKLKGMSFWNCMKEMPEEQKNKIFNQIGEYNASINSIRNNRFGYYAQTERHTEHWYDFFYSMLLDTYQDAERKKIEMIIPKDKLLGMLEADREIFEQVTEPKLVHWDLWPGNVFVTEDNITGFIDFERCLWGDELLEVGFRTYDCEKAFLKGYGIFELSKEQQIRAQWYDIYLFLICYLESDYRQYDNRWSYEWGGKMLLEWTTKIEERIHNQK